MTREELNNLAKKEGILINWELWDELVNKTREDINNALKEYKKPENKVFVFDLHQQKVVHIFNTPRQCAEHYGISRQLVTNYKREHKPYWKLMIEFRGE